MSEPTNVVDTNQSGCNMYGCMPCPKCQSEFRWPKQDGTIMCDDCGHMEPGVFRRL